MPLTDVEVKQAQPGQVLRDGAGGLYLVVAKTGRKTWYRDFSLAGRRSTDKLGEYPALSVRDARRTADDSRRLVAAGINPNEQKRAEADQASLAAQAARQALRAQREWALLKKHAPADPVVPLKREFGRLKMLAHRNNPKANFAAVNRVELPALRRAMTAYRDDRLPRRPPTATTPLPVWPCACWR